MNIAFLGMGNYGRAIAALVTANGHSYDYAEATEGRLLSQRADVAFITVPTHSVRQALADNTSFLDASTLIINCSKGIEEQSHLFVHQIVQDTGNYGDYFSLIGPSFAHGIISHEPTIVSLGYRADDHLSSLQKILETPYFKVVATEGYQALELASALKNLYAIACGYAAGLRLGANTQARLTMIALNEFETLANALHFTKYSLTSPGIMGDLLLTCTSGHSRNYLYGFSLADESADSIDPTKTTVEGYHTSHSIGAIAESADVRMPLATLVRRIIAGEVISADTFKQYVGEL